MKNSKAKKILISAIFCSAIIFSAFTQTALAVGEDDVPGDDPYITDANDDPTDPGYDDPSLEETEPDDTEPDYTQEVTEETTSPYEEETTEEATEDPDSDNTEETWTEYTEDDSDYTEETTKYYFDTDDDYDENASYQEYTSPSVSLYNSDSKVDTNTLNKDDWSKILVGLQNATGSDDGDDFSAIQNNTVKGDSGQWYLYVGILFVLLSVSGFAFSVISWQKQKKKFAAAGVGKKESTASKNSAPRYSSDNKNRDKGDYGDSYSQKKRSKQDTDEVKLPDGSKGKHFK